MTGQRMLLFGGSFNPPHRRHVALARDAANAVRADQIRVTPTNINPQRQDEPPIDGRHRAAMLRLAFRDEPRAVIDTTELDRGGASYMIDTLRSLRREHPDATFFMLLGGDQALNFHTWKDPQAILELATPVVAPRAPLDAAALAAEISRTRGSAAAAQWTPWILPLAAEPDSSTQARQRLAGGASPPPSLIDAEVLRYIQSHHLYA
jgi:nicotinate-nucleotide adenylyltransferase